MNRTPILEGEKRVMRLLVGAASAIAIACSVLSGPATAADPVVMRISHQLPPAHHIAQLVDNFAAEVEKLSDNGIDVQVLGATQAYKPDQNHPAVARGQIEAALSVNFQWGNTIPEMNVVTIPYYFTDLKRIEKFPGSDAAKMLEAKLAEKGVRNIAWLYTTRQSIFTSSKAPLIKVDDLKGVKIRGLNALVDKGLEAAGAAPSSMPGSEVYQALQTGVLDAGLTDVSAAESRKYYEVQKYGTVAPFFTVYFHLYVNPAWFDKLSAENKAALLKAARLAEKDSLELTEETAEEAIGVLRKKKMDIHEQTDAEVEQWRAVIQPPVIDAFKASSSDAAALLTLVDKL